MKKITDYSTDIAYDDIYDPETYYYFRDIIAWKGAKEYISKKHNIKFRTDTDKITDAQKVQNSFDVQRIINKYSKQYNRQRQKFYLYNGKVYSYSYMGGEIALDLWENEDLVNILNQLLLKDKFVTRLIQKIKKIVLEMSASILSVCIV